LTSDGSLSFNNSCGNDIRRRAEETGHPAICPAVRWVCGGVEAGDVKLTGQPLNLTEIVYNFVIRLKLTTGKAAGIVLHE
jgi:hypothetical protein